MALSQFLKKMGATSFVKVTPVEEESARLAGRIAIPAIATAKMATVDASNLFMMTSLFGSLPNRWHVERDVCLSFNTKKATAPDAKICLAVLCVSVLARKEFQEPGRCGGLNAAQRLAIAAAPAIDARFE
jgi:hypothetical protein